MKFPVAVDDCHVTRLPIGRVGDRLWVGFVVVGTGLDEGWPFDRHVHLYLDDERVRVESGGGGGSDDEWYEYVTIDYQNQSLKVVYFSRQGELLAAEDQVAVPEA